MVVEGTLFYINASSYSQSSSESSSLSSLCSWSPVTSSSFSSSELLLRLINSAPLGVSCSPLPNPPRGGNHFCPPHRPSHGPSRNRSSATIAGSRGACLSPPTLTYCNPTTSSFCATTSAPRGDRPPPPLHMQCRATPTGIYYRAPIAALRGDRPWPPSCTSTCPTGSRSRAPTAAS